MFQHFLYIGVLEQVVEVCKAVCLTTALFLFIFSNSIKLLLSTGLHFSAHEKEKYCGRCRAFRLR